MIILNVLLTKSLNFACRPPISSERPEHLRLKLDPRGSSVPSSNFTSTTKSSASDATDDKWSKVFTKSSNSKDSDTKASQVRVENVFSGLSVSGQETEVTKAPEKVLPVENKASDKKLPVNSKKEAEELKKKAAEEEKEKRRLENEQKEALKAQMIENSTTILDTGLKGSSLQEHIASLQTKPSASAFLCTLLKRQSDGNAKWLSAGEFGLSLKYLSSSDINNQAELLREVEKYCGTYKFPKIDIKGSPRSLLEVIFQLLYKDEVVLESSFLKWLDEDSDIPGHTTAIVQTTNFMNLFRDEDDGDYDDDDDDEVDAPREVVA